jgi:DUF2946 family protein
MSEWRIPEPPEVHGWKSARICAKKAAMSAHRNRIAAWLALAGIALNASWPLLANARPNAPALPSEVCTATGLKHPGEGLPGEAPGKGVQPSHCTLCPFNAERGAAIPYAKHILLSSAPVGVQHAVYCDAVRPEAALDPAAPPRAPPFPS